MNPIPSLLMVTWNRREYFERTMANLLADPSDFRLHIWDNGSEDGVREIISDLTDPRIVARHYHSTNAGQFAAWHWFLDNCRTDIGGKLDDDILGPQSWMKNFSEMLVAEPRFGLLGAWVYLPTEWDETLAQHKILQLNEHRIFQNGWVAGCIFVGRIQLLRRYSSTDGETWGTPLKQMDITRAGFISGYPLPIAFAENLDDPRSPHCRMNRPGGWDQFAAYSARMRKFAGPKEYGEWIAADARTILTTPIKAQIQQSFPSPLQLLRQKLARGAAKLKAIGTT
ncbi:glycosyltransferase family 2 protein [Bradyrhizobium sp. 157]|uniref:glycosyltransferase family A protein n=1 Tax=Bradyrhizobium sp. 157 TaxID=2782631 RepID=UPI001FF75792|nr:glycosyltransferase family A protein [Bradyrhizobium sp. 157]MCK1642986.1 glycosyltransferase family 2 protein [Bradyrhizobium sp. 157]